MYFTVRKLVWIVILGIVFLVLKLIRTKKIQKHLLQFVLCVCSSIFLLILTNVPFENLLYRTDLPENIFNYTSSGTIQNTIYGKDSCFILYEDIAGNYKSLIIPRDEKGYMIPYFNINSEVYSTPPGMPSFVVGRARNTSDYYLSGIGSYSCDSLAVSDNVDSQFYIINTSHDSSSGSDHTIYLYYAHLNSFSEDYCITINGKEFCVANLKA